MTFASEIAAKVRARDSRRRHIADEIVRRFDRSGTKGAEREQKLTADILCMLTSIETYDALARAGHGDEQTAKIVFRLEKSEVGKA